MENTYKVKLLAKKTGLYITYVFLDLDNDEYIMCTQPPNWSINIDIKEIGYISIENIKEGETYLNRKTLKTDFYRYTKTYIKDFVKINKQKEIIL